MKNFLLITLLSALFPLALSGQTGAAGGKEVIVVFKTHFDIGYTDWAANVRKNYAGPMAEGALALIDSSASMPAGQEFRWIVAGWPMKEMIEKSDPQVRRRIEEAVRRGFFSVHALPFTFETEACEPESVVRSLSYSSEINRNAGLPLPIDAKQTDVPSHSWILPTILANSGIRFLHIGCNAASRSPEVPLLFWWEGPDGSRVMTMYFGPYYGTSPAPPEGWPFRTWLAIIHTNDNTGAPTFAEFREAISSIKEQNPGAKVRTGSMADFYNAIMAENPDLPVVKSDMPDTWIHGYMSMPTGVKSSRRTASRIFSLEALNTLMPVWGASDDAAVAGISQNAMEEIHLFNEHTFGLAMSHGHGGYWAYGKRFEDLRAMGYYEPLEFSWKEKGLHVTEAENLVMPAWSQRMKNLAASVGTAGSRIVVYNPLPWKRSGVVTVQAWYSPGNSLVNLATGKRAVVSTDHNIIRFIAEEIPPMGYATFVPDTAMTEEPAVLVADRKKLIIANEYLEVKIDRKTGTITSFTDKATGRQLAASDGRHNTAQYFSERFSKEITDKYADDYVKNKESTWGWAYPELGRINLDGTPYAQLTGSEPEIEIKSDNISASAMIHFSPMAGNNHHYTMIINLYSGSRYAEIIWSINGKPADPWPEAGWMAFPVNIGNPSFRLGRPGGIADPAVDFIKGSNLDFCFVRNGVAVLDSAGNGVGIMSPDAPGVSLGRPGLWKSSTSYTPTEPAVYFNLYNNQWSTNFTEWIEGSWSARFYLWPITGFAAEPALITPAREFADPLDAVFYRGPGGMLPSSTEGISLSVKGIIITAFAPDRSGKGILLRLWEEAGNAGDVTVTFPQGAGYASATPVNLRGERKDDALKIIDDSFTFRIKPYEPVSFILN